jgi:CRP/FNR family transcriptional regulator, cyclic AMP receptor protein
MLAHVSEDPACLRAFLSGTSFFGGLESALLDQVIPLLKEEHFPAGAVVFCEGDSGKSMYIVRAGELIVQRLCRDGIPSRLLMMRPGDHFGVTTLIEMEPRPFSCVAEKDSLLYELTNADLYRLYKQNPHGYLVLLQNINRELCRRLRKAAARIATLEDKLHEHRDDLAHSEHAHH